MKFKQTLLLLILTGCTVDKNQTDDTTELIGMWQDSSQVASGYTDNYRFFENGDFIFGYNEMICDKRTLNYSGTWELNEGDQLKLTIKKKRIVEGGKLVPAMGSCASEYDIEGGEVRSIELTDFEIQGILLSPITEDKERPYVTRTFNKKQFWKLRDDPNSK